MTLPTSRIRALLTSKTCWGTIAAVAGWLASQPKIDKTTILTGAGVVLTSIGVRDSVTKIIEQIKKP